MTKMTKTIQWRVVIYNDYDDDDDDDNDNDNDNSKDNRHYDKSYSSNNYKMNISKLK